MYMYYVHVHVHVLQYVKRITSLALLVHVQSEVVPYPVPYYPTCHVGYARSNMENTRLLYCILISSLRHDC